MELERLLKILLHIQTSLFLLFLYVFCKDGNQFRSYRSIQLLFAKDPFNTCSIYVNAYWPRPRTWTLYLRAMNFTTLVQSSLLILTMCLVFLLKYCPVVERKIFKMCFRFYSKFLAFEGRDHEIHSLWSSLSLWMLHSKSSQVIPSCTSFRQENENDNKRDTTTDKKNSKRSPEWP